MSHWALTSAHRSGFFHPEGFAVPQIKWPLNLCGSNCVGLLLELLNSFGMLELRCSEEEYFRDSTPHPTWKIALQSLSSVYTDELPGGCAQLCSVSGNGRVFPNPESQWLYPDSSALPWGWPS